MSGGYFDYKNHYCRDMADSLLHLIKNNNVEDEYGFSRKFTDDTLRIFYTTHYYMKLCDMLLHEIDYLVCSDTSEDGFDERIFRNSQNLLLHEEQNIKHIIGEEMFAVIKNAYGVAETQQPKDEQQMEMFEENE